ncbi:enoyl-CoA hydratase/isomerase [Alcanivorax balearicus MACL04]|uniref:Enoyl-CoA hydratase/isomerase n=1 Tax=Alloalcanivorax balearicus MACL04 TaxID=1177182 RepID=A0ABT2R3X3_9GAMM|nr:enoyl-CoA hydratase-related protein [Alloalcanivorax balearicus]MCU5784480.1 enoyl-CoA hydratase/isomerase [Alloalcanivorax balearicus MACL04]
MTDNTNNAVTLERLGDHIALVTLNRPQARNAVNGDVAQGLEAAVKTTEADNDIRAVILQGSGDKVFCAGADLKEISAGNAHRLVTKEGGFAGFVHSPRRKVWIAALNGLALAGGLEIALTCDLRVASPKVAFGLPEVKRGLVALAGGLYRLPRNLPRAIALELIATGNTLDARRAYDFGLVNRLVEADQVLDTARELAETIAANAPIAVQESLVIARLTHDLDEAALIAAGDKAREYLVTTEDYQEGPRAFIEKREPVWTGR